VRKEGPLGGDFGDETAGAGGWEEAGVVRGRPANANGALSFEMRLSKVE
jgi:hypothetical protein